MLIGSIDKIYKKTKFNCPLTWSLVLRKLIHIRWTKIAFWVDHEPSSLKPQHSKNTSVDNYLVQQLLYNESLQYKILQRHQCICNAISNPAPANSSSFSYYWLCSHLVMYWISACSLNHSRTLAPSSMSCTYVISSRSKKCEMNYDSALCHKRLTPRKKMC